MRLKERERGRVQKRERERKLKNAPIVTIVKINEIHQAHYKAILQMKHNIHNNDKQ